VIAAARRSFSVSIPGRAPLVLGPRTLVMGVLNVTPDSFSDGGKALNPARALDLAVAMEASGADIIDIGAESTRPGAPPVSAEDEMARARPVLKAVASRVKVPISIDTYKAATARMALDEGACIVNDISAFAYDPDLARLVAERKVPAIVMHTRGKPQDMYAQAEYRDVVEEIISDLQRSINQAHSKGVDFAQLIVDPGLGFAKRAPHSMAALVELGRLAELGLPIAVGPSRKSFLAAETGPLSPEDRDWPTAAAVTVAILSGAHIVRVHAVEKLVHAVRFADGVRRALLR
jgi:dihydropteroate synthase